MTTVRSDYSKRDLVMLLALAGIWGFTFFFIELAIESLTPLWLVSVRTITGFVVLLAFAATRRVTPPRGRTLWGHIAVVAILGNVVPWTLVAWAQESITSSLTAVIYSLIPAMTLLMSVMVALERFTTRKVGGLLLALIGTIVVTGVDSNARVEPLAVSTVLMACLLLAAQVVYAKRFVMPRVTPLPMVTAQLGIAFVAATPIAVLADGAPDWERVTVQAIGAAVILGAIGTGVAFILYYGLIDRVGATNATLVTYLMPVIGIAAGWLFLNESISAALVIGSATIISGVWLAQRSTHHDAIPIVTGT